LMLMVSSVIILSFERSSGSLRDDVFPFTPKECDTSARAPGVFYGIPQNIFVYCVTLSHHRFLPSIHRQFYIILSFLSIISIRL
jgi:hypothetical protein